LLQVGTPLCIVVDSAGDIAAFSNYKQAPQSKAAAVAPPKASLPQSSAKPSATAPAASTASATAAPSHHSIPADLLAGPAVAHIQAVVDFEISSCRQVLRLLHENPHVNPLLVKGSGPKVCCVYFTSIAAVGMQILFFIEILCFKLIRTFTGPPAQG
jgi:hypothetical protein